MACHIITFLIHLVIFPSHRIHGWVVYCWLQVFPGPNAAICSGPV